jgi:hypothetical protein
MREHTYPRQDHVRFEVAGHGNQDRVKQARQLSSTRCLPDTESNWSASPRSRAPSLDPTSRPRLRRLLYRGFSHLSLDLFSDVFCKSGAAAHASCCAAVR